MHIPDGMLSTPAAATTWVAAVPLLAWGVSTARRKVTEGRFVLMSVMAAMVFALQMLNFPVAGGTSGHFAGGALAAIVLGPAPALLVISSVLVVQAFFFGDGGITALGANILDMAVIAPIVAWWTYSLALRMGHGRTARVAGAFAAGWTAVVASALSAALLIWLSGAAPLFAVGGAMAFWHALIGIGEGLVTAGLVAYVGAVRPELLRSGTEPVRARGLALSFGAVALLAAGLSFLASRFPDGLERVAGQLRFGPAAADGSASPLAGYVVPGIANEALAGVLAGVAGVIVTGVLLFALLRLSRRRTPVAPAARPTAMASGPTEGIHRHEHEHEGEVHRHVHHHASPPVHEHGHGTGVERLTYLVSPLHDLDPRAKLLSALVLIVAIVVSPPLRPFESVALLALLLAASAIGRLPMRWVLGRTALVLPVAGTIALFAPLARTGAAWTAAGAAAAYSSGGWIAAWAILSKAFLAVLVTVVVSGTTPMPKLIRALEALRVPDVFVGLFSFLYRFAEVFREQLASLRTAFDSRAPSMGRLRRWRLFGNLAGNLFLRAYDRGERVHMAMLSRGFDGTLPSNEVLAFAARDAVLFTVAVLAAAAQALY